MTTITPIYTPDQITAAHRLHDTCHELLAITADEPARSSAADFEQIWRAWHDAYGRAYRVHEDAEHDYRHSFGHAPTIPEAHDVIATVTRTRVELLRSHVPRSWTWDDQDGAPARVTVLCVCGGEASGPVPENMNGVTEIAWVFAAHVAGELPH